jgi:hypothetical protein
MFFADKLFMMVVVGCLDGRGFVSVRTKQQKRHHPLLCRVETQSQRSVKTK